MKRLFSFFLALCLSLSLISCGTATVPAPGSEDPSEPEPIEPLALDTLRVEFVVGERDTDELLKLKAELPPLLIAALADEGVDVGTVEVTFGTSADATVFALRDSSVDMAFLPSEVYLENEDALQLLALEAAPLSASELLLTEELAEIEGVEADSLFYREAVVLRGDFPIETTQATARALVMLCSCESGNAALRQYGCASYLIDSVPRDLLAPYRAYLAWMSAQKE